MDDYISRKAIMDAYEAEQRKHGPWRFEAIIKSVPAADVRPVVRGRFVRDGPRFAGGVDWWHCSNCGSLVCGVEARFAFCPHCGADMRSENDG